MESDQFRYNFIVVDSQNLLQIDTSATAERTRSEASRSPAAGRPVGREFRQPVEKTNLQLAKAAGEESSPRPAVRDGMKQELYESRA